MRHCMMSLFACATLTVVGSLAADERKAGDSAGTSDRTQVVQFLKKHVIGKTLVAPKKTFKWADNKMEGDLQGQMSYHNLTETAHGFSFHITTVTKQTLYDLDTEGKRLQPGRDLSGTHVARYEIGERLSTKKLTGTARLLSTTLEGVSLEGIAPLITGMKVADGKLRWNETLPGYVDLPVPGGKYKPGTSDETVTIALVSGKVQVEMEQTNFYVDPDTLKRTPTKEKLPLLVMTEVDRK